MSAAAGTPDAGWPPPTDRARVRRAADRGRYDRAAIDAVLDEGLVAHVGVISDGAPVVIPMAYVRVDDHVVLHGAVGNHLLRTMADGGPACVTVTLLDGLVLARSAFHHSVNYRSVVVHGTAERIDDPAEKRAVSDALVEHLVAGRTADTRPPNDAELRATLLVRLPLTEASAKIRRGPPIDDPEDMDLGYWAGVLPLGVGVGDPEAAPELVGAEAAVPDYLVGWSR